MLNRRRLRAIRRLCTLAAALVTTATLTTGNALASESSTEEKRVHNAMQIVFRPDMPNAFCTIGAVGTDNYGREIAISAGHCLRDPDYADREIHEDIGPIYDRHDIGFGPIGYVRYFKDPEGSLLGYHPTKDYMVIELVKGVTPSAQGPHLKQTGQMEVPGGKVSPNALTPALANERLLGAAWSNTNELVVSGQKGVWYGRITSNANGMYQCHAPNEKGDSGGPAIWHVPGSEYPSEANGFQASGPWAGITTGTMPSYPQYAYTSSANILADLRARDAASSADVYGAGFEVTPNP
ncbi:hypothetical protein [Streptomyces sp. NPDC058620]|uniref:hypothetical protein n=1 Tax=Streptomyces sp. NPDC058620 TaxID=3346560 RepID=UPI0036652DE0